MDEATKRADRERRQKEVEQHYVYHPLDSARHMVTSAASLIHQQITHSLRYTTKEFMVCSQGIERLVRTADPMSEEGIAKLDSIANKLDALYVEMWELI